MGLGIWLALVSEIRWIGLSANSVPRSQEASSVSTCSFVFLPLPWACPDWLPAEERHVERDECPSFPSKHSSIWVSSAKTKWTSHPCLTLIVNLQTQELNNSCGCINTELLWMLYNLVWPKIYIYSFSATEKSLYHPLPS